MRQETGLNPDATPTHGHAKPSRPKLPCFDEQRDDIDAYLERFKRFAKSQSWALEIWAVSLSPLLSGKELDVYASMAPDEANNYEALKKTLLKRYQLTDEGFCTKFRESKPQKEETVVQYVARLRRYITRWVELSDIEHSFDAVSDLMLRKQFISMCLQELALFLKERVPRTIEDTTKLEEYVEAHGGSFVTNRSTRATPTAVNRPSQSTNTQQQHSSQRSETRSDRSKKCYICHKEGHFASECQKNRKNKAAAAAQEQEEQPARRRNNRRRPVQLSQSPPDWRKRDHDKREENPRTTTGASCQSKPSPESQIVGGGKDGRLQLANWKSLPYAGALCNDKIRNGQPLCRGFVGNHSVEVLRDTGCNSAAVKKDLINESQLNGRISSCVRMDGTLRRFPMATVVVDTPY